MGTRQIHTTLDLNGNAIVGAETAAAGTNTQQVATTAFVTRAVQAGNARWLDVIPLSSSGLVTGLLGVDAALAGSDFDWVNAAYVPPGRSIYFECYVSGSLLTSKVTAALYTLAATPVLVAGSTVTATGSAGQRVRSGAFVLPDGLYQVHLQTQVAGTGTLKQARLIFL